jgi:hypothetical protein
MKRPCHCIAMPTCRMCCIKAAGRHRHRCPLHTQAVKLGVSRKQGDTSWGATYIFPVLVSTEASETFASRALCQVVGFRENNGRQCQKHDYVNAGGGRVQAQRFQGTQHFQLSNILASWRGSGHHELMPWGPCADGCNGARHTRGRRRREAASDVGAHNRSLSPSWSRAGAAADQLEVIVVQASCSGFRPSSYFRVFCNMTQAHVETMDPTGKLRQPLKLRACGTRAATCSKY